MSHDDEGAFLRETADEFGIPWRGAPRFERAAVEVADGAHLSALVWGEGEPEAVLLHGGAQNAHTWDAVALALARPLVAIDLPGHGHSSHRDPLHLTPAALATDVAAAVERLAPEAGAVVGMSLGGLTAIALADARPDLVRRLVVVDVTPSVDRERAAPIANFVDESAGPATFDELLELTLAFNPQRSEASLRRGITHNTRVREDGTVVWRHQMGDPDAPPIEVDLEAGDLWSAVGRYPGPLTLVLGGDSQVVREEDAEEVSRRNSRARVVTVDGAGHSVQGDRPVELARIIADVLEP